MLSILLFIIVLTFLIVIHELGHFFVALRYKVRVLEFGFGLPPKVKTIFHWKGIPFTFNALPIGGFVRMDGEDSTVNSEQQTVLSGKEKTPEGYPFYTRKLWQKILVVLAGPAVNIIFGMIVFSTLFSIYGIPKESHVQPHITAVAENSPAAKAGLQVNDELMTITTGDKLHVKYISSTADLISFVNDYRGKTLYIIVKRNGTEQVLPVYARKVDEVPAGEGTIGIALSDTDYTTVFYPGIEQPIRGTMYGIKQSFDFAKTILSALGTMGTSLFAGRIPNDVAGPVGIAHEVAKQDLFSSGWATGFNFAALLSINLGVMNLLPIPALDGGRILLLILEKFIKHKRFESISQNLNQFGLLFLVGLLILITVKDVIGLLH